MSSATTTTELSCPSSHITSFSGTTGKLSLASSTTMMTVPMPVLEPETHHVLLVLVFRQSGAGQVWAKKQINFTEWHHLGVTQPKLSHPDRFSLITAQFLPSHKQIGFYEAAGHARWQMVVSSRQAASHTFWSESLLFQTANLRCRHVLQKRSKATNIEIIRNGVITVSPDNTLLEQYWGWA